MMAMTSPTATQAALWKPNPAERAMIAPIKAKTRVMSHRIPLSSIQLVKHIIRRHGSDVNQKRTSPNLSYKTLQSPEKSGIMLS